MKIEIKHRWNSSVLFSIEASSIKLALEAAVEQGADLRGAYLPGPPPEGAYLEGAYLEGAYLEGAYLEGAYLRGADLRGANLRGAYLEGPKEDFFKVLDSAPHEVDGLRAAMVAGTIDGSTYSGECACLVGTIAKVRKCDVNTLTKDASRPAEKWFIMFRPGHTPKNHGGMKLTLKWLDEWKAKRASAEEAAK